MTKAGGAHGEPFKWFFLPTTSLRIFFSPKVLLTLRNCSMSMEKRTDSIKSSTILFIIQKKKEDRKSSQAITLLKKSLTTGPSHSFAT
jgi:hypothetical protein